MPALYVLKLSDGSYYVGSTNDLKKRLTRHSNRQVGATKFKLPFVLIYTEAYSTRGEAQAREYQIKKWKSRKAIERLISGKK